MEKYFEKKLNLELDKFKAILGKSYSEDIWKLFKLIYIFNILTEWFLSIKINYLTERYDNLKLENYIFTLKSSLVNSLKISLLSLEHELYLDFRNILESLLKYFYFLENPMRYVIYNDDNYLSFSNDLIEYFKKHPNFNAHKDLFASQNLWEIKCLYKEISGKIHDPVISKIKITNFLTEIQYDEKIIKSALDVFGRMIKELIWFSVIFNKNTVNSLSLESRDLILSFMNDKKFWILIGK